MQLKLTTLLMQLLFSVLSQHVNQDLQHGGMTTLLEELNTKCSGLASTMVFCYEHAGCYVKMILKSRTNGSTALYETKKIKLSGLNRTNTTLSRFCAHRDCTDRCRQLPKRLPVFISKSCNETTKHINSTFRKNKQAALRGPSTQKQTRERF